MKWIKLVVFVAIIGVIAYVLKKVDVAYYLSKENIEDVQAYLTRFGFFSGLILLVIWIILGSLCLTVIPAIMLGALMYGPIWGTVIGAVCATITALINMLLARYGLRNFVDKMFNKNKIYNNIIDGFAKNGVNYLMFTRLTIIFPFGLQNYFYGLTNVKPKTYTLVTFFCMIPVVFMYCYLTGSILEYGFGMRNMIIFTLIGLSFFIATYILKRIARKLGYAF